MNAVLVVGELGDATHVALIATNRATSE